MKLRPLIIDDLTRRDIKRVMDHAEVHRVSIQDIFDVMGHRRPPPGDDSRFVCVVRLGYRCVYTIENQGKHGWCRHLSVSVMGEGEAPSEAAVLMLLPEFGFRGGFKDMLSISTEHFVPGKIAVNVLQQL